MMLMALSIYLLFGLIFAITFFVTGYRRIEESAAGTSWYVRLLWTPAAIALWPLLILRWKQSAAVINKEQEQEQGKEESP